MVDRMGLAPHEFYELHGLLAAEVTSAQKLETTTDMIQDRELKSFMENSLAIKRRRIDRMQQIFQDNVGTLDH